MNSYLLFLYLMLVILGALLAVSSGLIGKYLYRKKIIKLTYQGAFIVDVREASEYEKGHYPSATNIAYQQIVRHLNLFPESKSQPIILYCVHGARARIAAKRLRSLGYNAVYPVALKILPRQ